MLLPVKLRSGLLPSPAILPRLLAKQVFSRLVVGWLVVFLLLLGASCTASAQALNKQKITASYVYNFAKNIEWPNEASLGRFEIAVYSADPSPVYAELSQLAERAKLKNLPIQNNATAPDRWQARYRLASA